MAYNRWLSSSYGLELYHHGIKGQKWGVRRFQNRDGTRIATHKKTYTTFGANKQDKTLGERHRIPKGTKMYRTTTAKDEDNTGMTYVSYQTADRLYYKAWVTNSAKRDHKDTYEKTYKLKEDLLIPSRDEVRKAYSDAVIKLGKKTVDDALKQFVIGDRVINNDINQAKKDLKTYDAMRKAYSKGETVLPGVNTKTGESVTTQFKIKNGKPVVVRSMTGTQMTNAEAYEGGVAFYHRIIESNKNKTLSDFAVGMGTLTRNPKVKEEMIKSLKAKGYNAIVDEAGVGSFAMDGKTATREGQETLILFDREKSLTEVKTKKIDKNYNEFVDRDAARARLRKMRAREAI